MVVSMEHLDRAHLKDRHDPLLREHYIQLHVTVLSVALGVAGIAAVSLLTSSPQSATTRGLFWIFWVDSLLVTTTAYGGVMVGSFLLPARIPHVSDLALPLFQAVLEFMLFATISTPLTGSKTTRTVTIVWFGSMAAFCILSWLAIARARWLIRQAPHSDDARTTVHGYTGGLRKDLLGAGGTALVALGGALAFAIPPRPPIAAAYIVGVVLGIILLMGLVTHDRTSARLQRLIEQVTITEPES